MSIQTCVPDQTPLPQTGFEVPAELVEALQQKGFTLTLPQSAGELHEIARKHEHALAHFAPYIIRRRELIFCIQAENAPDFFTFHLSSDGTPGRDGIFHHHVGYRNTPAPEDVKTIANFVADVLLPLLSKHVEGFEPTILDDENHH